MDKFVVRTRKTNAKQMAKSVSKDSVKTERQMTIESLRGVVVIEDILRSKALLEVCDQNVEIMLTELKMLKEKIPSRKVLTETKIGFLINKLRKHDNCTVAELATEIYHQWKSYFKEKQGKIAIEVQSDNETSKLRRSGRKLLTEALQNAEESAILAEAIESFVYHSNGNTRSYYKRHIRGIVFSLHHSSTLRAEVLSKRVTVKDLCADRISGKHGNM